MSHQSLGAATSPSCLANNFADAILFLRNRCILAIEIKMSIGRTLYNALFRRTSTFVVTIVVGGFIFERVFDEGMDNLWENMNRGVSI